MRGAFLLSVLVAAPLGAQAPLVTDRPDFTESPVTVPAGLIQVEFGATGTSVAPNRTDLDIELLARVGLGQRLEFRAGSAEPDRGYVGAKLNLVSSDALELGIVPGLTFRQRGRVADDRVSPELHLAASRPLGSASLSAMTSVFLQAAVDDGIRMAQTLVLGGALGGPLGGFLELASEWGGGLPAVHLVHAGGTVLLSPVVQLDLHGGTPLGAEGESFVGGGLAIRFRLP